MNLIYILIINQCEIIHVILVYNKKNKKIMILLKRAMTYLSSYYSFTINLEDPRDKKV